MLKGINTHPYFRDPTTTKFIPVDTTNYYAAGQPNNIGGAQMFLYYIGLATNALEVDARMFDLNWNYRGHPNSTLLLACSDRADPGSESY